MRTMTTLLLATTLLAGCALDEVPEGEPVPGTAEVPVEVALDSLGAPQDSVRVGLLVRFFREGAEMPCQEARALGIAVEVAPLGTNDLVPVEEVHCFPTLNADPARRIFSGVYVYHHPVGPAYRMFEVRASNSAVATVLGVTSQEWGGVDRFVTVVVD